MKYYVVQKANCPLIGVYEYQYKLLFSGDKEFILIGEFESIEELIRIERN